jgi:hypothetical protein
MVDLIFSIIIAFILTIKNNHAKFIQIIISSVDLSFRDRKVKCSKIENF